jgi:hypothetical protein
MLIHTAKNNSDYIYYSKFNESGVESSSKNGSAKRKYTKKTLANPESQIGVKSAKSNSFHVPRILAKNVCEKQLAGYPQSCCEVSSPSITSNSGNLAISQAEFSHDVKPFNN